MGRNAAWTDAVVFTHCRRVGQSTAPMASECSGLSAVSRGKHVHSDLKASTSARAWQFMSAYPV